MNEELLLDLLEEKERFINLQSFIFKSEILKSVYNIIEQINEKINQFTSNNSV